MPSGFESAWMPLYVCLLTRRFLALFRPPCYDCPSLGSQPKTVETEAKTLLQVEFYIWTANKTIRSTFLWMNPSPAVSSAIFSETYQARPQVNRSKIG